MLKVMKIIQCLLDINWDENPIHEKEFVDNLKINQRLIRINYAVAIKN